MKLSPETSQVVSRIVKSASAITEERKILALVLDEVASFFGCDGGAIFVYSRRSASLLKIRSLSAREQWDQAVLLGFFRMEKPPLAEDIIMAPVRAGSEVIGVLALQKKGGFARGAGKIATEMLKISGIAVGERRRRRALEIGWAAGEALARGARKKDVIYRILHGARRIIDYDHSATVFARVDERTAGVVAQQVAWAAGKGSLVGRRFHLDWRDVPVGAALAGGEEGRDGGPACRESETGRKSETDREAEGGRESETDSKSDNGCGHLSVSRTWDAVRAVREEPAPEKQSGLILPLSGPQGHVGLLEIASARREFFRDSDLEAARILAPYLVLCLCEGTP